MSHYRELKVWHKSMDLAEEVYALTRLLPKEELYGLTNQIRRAAVSIPSNIAEGAGRKSTRDYIHFLKIAYGSLNELETQLFLCCRLHYLESSAIEKALKISSEIGKMVNAMIQKLMSDA